MEGTPAGPSFLLPSASSVSAATVLPLQAGTAAGETGEAGGAAATPGPAGGGQQEDAKRARRAAAGGGRPAGGRCPRQWQRARNQ